MFVQDRQGQRVEIAEFLWAAKERQMMVTGRKGGSGIGDRIPQTLWSHHCVWLPSTAELPSLSARDFRRGGSLATWKIRNGASPPVRIFPQVLVVGAGSGSHIQPGQDAQVLAEPAGRLSCVEETGPVGW